VCLIASVYDNFHSVTKTGLGVYKDSRALIEKAGTGAVKQVVIPSARYKVLFYGRRRIRFFLGAKEVPPVKCTPGGAYLGA